MNPFTRLGALVKCVLLLLLPFTSASHAAQDNILAWRDANSLPALVDHLELWIDANSDLPRRSGPATIEWINTAEVAHLKTSARAAKIETTRGLYDPEISAIYLIRPWGARNPYDVSVLLHELIHHRQNGDGTHWYCPGAQELDAYRLQDAWLAELGLEANVNWIAVILEAGCTPRDIHPD